MSLSVTLLPAPETPMSTVFCPSGTSSEKPSSDRSVCRRSAFVDAGGSSGNASAPRHHSSTSAQNASSTRIASQPSTTARVVAPADALGAARGGEPLQAAHERHGGAEAGALHQAEPDVLELVEQLQPLDELGAGEIEQVDAR